MSGRDPWPAIMLLEPLVFPMLGHFVDRLVPRSIFTSVGEQNLGVALEVASVSSL